VPYLPHAGLDWFTIASHISRTETYIGVGNDSGLKKHTRWFYFSFMMILCNL